MGYLFWVDQAPTPATHPGQRVCTDPSSPPHHPKRPPLGPAKPPSLLPRAPLPAIHPVRALPCLPRLSSAVLSAPPMDGSPGDSSGLQVLRGAWRLHNASCLSGEAQIEAAQVRMKVKVVPSSSRGLGLETLGQPGRARLCGWLQPWRRAARATPPRGLGEGRERPISWAPPGEAPRSDVCLLLSGCYKGTRHARGG